MIKIQQRTKQERYGKDARDFRDEILREVEMACDCGKEEISRLVKRNDNKPITGEYCEFVSELLKKDGFDVDLELTSKATAVINLRWELIKEKEVATPTAVFDSEKRLYSFVIPAKFSSKKHKAFMDAIEKEYFWYHDVPYNNDATKVNVWATPEKLVKLDEITKKIFKDI